MRLAIIYTAVVVMAGVLIGSLITAVTKHEPDCHYEILTQEFGISICKNLAGIEAQHCSGHTEAWNYSDISVRFNGNMMYGKVCEESKK